MGWPLAAARPVRVLNPVHMHMCPELCLYLNASRAHLLFSFCLDAWSPFATVVWPLSTPVAGRSDCLDHLGSEEAACTGAGAFSAVS